MCEICSKLPNVVVFNVNFEQISHIALVFPLFILNKLTLARSALPQKSNLQLSNFWLKNLRTGSVPVLE